MLYYVLESLVADKNKKMLNDTKNQEPREKTSNCTENHERTRAVDERESLLKNEADRPGPTASPLSDQERTGEVDFWKRGIEKGNG